MKRLHWYLGSFVLCAVLMAPAGIQAEERHDCPARDGRQGYYDNNHKDCHYWDDHEDHAYQTWAQTKHKTKREYSKLKNKERSEYWEWRHEHPDNDRDH